MKFLLVAKIIKVFTNSLLPCILFRNNLPVYKELKCLAEVKRFSMAVMFLSEKDKEGG